MKLVKLVKSDKDEIAQELLPNILLLAKAEKGINVVKRLLPEIHDAVAQQKLASLFVDNFHDCIDNCYANYSIQTMVDYWESTITEPLYTKLYGYIIKYSTEKISSNVVEKLLLTCPEAIRAKYISEICECKKLGGNTNE
jgi:hypothetical protein